MPKSFFTKLVWFLWSLGLAYVGLGGRKLYQACLNLTGWGFYPEGSDIRIPKTVLFKLPLRIVNSTDFSLIYELKVGENWETPSTVIGFMYFYWEHLASHPDDGARPPAEFITASHPAIVRMIEQRKA